MDSAESGTESAGEKILFLETRIRHLTNELRVTREEKEAAAANYFDMHSSMGRKVEWQTGLLKKILDNLPACAYWKDARGSFIGCNAKYAETLGAAGPDSVFGRDEADFYKDNADAAALAERDRKVFESNSSEFHKTELRRSASGKVFWADCTRVPLPGADGDPAGLLVMFEDITSKLETEREQKALEEQVRQAQKLQSLGILAGGIAHDFNNILTPIMGYAEMAAGLAAEDGKLSAYLKRISDGSARAKELVGQILTFSRRGPENRRAVRPDIILREALKLLRGTISAAVSIRLSMDEDICPLMADPIQIHQIIINLCTNAVHAMPDGGEIDITLQNITLDSAKASELSVSQGRYARLSVKDTGKGIPQDIINRIFEPFFTTKTPGEGTGMGLAVVSKIVKSMGGAVTVKSAPGEGAEFHLYFPASSDRAAPARDGALAGAVLMGDMEKILVVDDERDILDMMQNLLASINYEAVTAYDPVKALEIFKARPRDFDAVITDQTMPGMNGERLCREILCVRRDIPIVICTGNSDAITAENAKAAGAAGYILKPVSRRELASAIGKLLSKESAQNDNRKNL
jgi:PAS domain S-box-containing protein